MGLTDDPSDPRLTRGVDTEPRPQSEAYLVLPEAERAKGWVRPFRDGYVHIGPAGPDYPLRDLTDAEFEQYGEPPTSYVQYEPYPLRDGLALGRFWTQAQLDKVGKGCGTRTVMGRALAETYAREPHFYGATYCVGCSMHLPVGEFVWDGTQERVGS